MCEAVSHGAGEDDTLLDLWTTLIDRGHQGGARSSSWRQRTPDAQGESPSAGSGEDSAVAASDVQKEKVGKTGARHPAADRNPRKTGEAGSRSGGVFLNALRETIPVGVIIPHAGRSSDRGGTRVAPAGSQPPPPRRRVS
jgi:hypothetical protein